MPASESASTSQPMPITQISVGWRSLISAMPTRARPRRLSPSKITSRSMAPAGTGAVIGRRLSIACATGGKASRRYVAAIAKELAISPRRQRGRTIHRTVVTLMRTPRRRSEPGAPSHLATSSTELLDGGAQRLDVGAVLRRRVLFLGGVERGPGFRPVLQLGKHRGGVDVHCRRARRGEHDFHIRPGGEVVFQQVMDPA